jgi:uncharacterized membrane protein YfcA
VGPIGILFVVLGVFTAIFCAFWLKWSQRGPTGDVEPGTEIGAPNPPQVGIGFFTDFLDTLGIGSFATTTALFRFLKQVPDRLIPGTLNVGHTLPTVLQAYIYISIIEVDPMTLILMIGAAVAGAWLGAGIVSGFSRRNVQIGMGTALLIAATIICVRQLGDVSRPQGTLALSGVLLGVGIVGNFLLGALMTIGVGLYAPCMILVALLGMQGSAAFPIMMGSCAFLMPVASMRFIEKRCFSPRAALGLMLGGLPAVAIAAWIVKSLPLKWVNWLVIVVVVYTAVTMLRTAWLEKPGALPPAKGQS